MSVPSRISPPSIAVLIYAFTPPGFASFTPNPGINILDCCRYAICCCRRRSVVYVIFFNPSLERSSLMSRPDQTQFVCRNIPQKVQSTSVSSSFLPAYESVALIRPMMTSACLSFCSYFLLCQSHEKEKKFDPPFCRLILGSICYHRSDKDRKFSDLGLCSLL